MDRERRLVGEIAQCLGKSLCDEMVIPMARHVVGWPDDSLALDHQCAARVGIEVERFRLRRLTMQPIEASLVSEP